MARLLKRFFIPLLIISALIISAAIIFVMNDPNAPVTVYCVTEIRSKNQHKRYRYDEKGRFLEISSNNGQKVQYYSYDENGNPTHYPDPGGGNIAATYDENGNMLTYKHYYSDINDPSADKEYIYNETGKLIKKISYHDGVPTSIESNTYDEDGNLVKTLIYYNDVLTKFTNYIYDEEGKHLISLQDYTVSNATYSLHRSIDYDHNGNQISYKEYDDGQLCHYNTHQYDQAGRLITFESMLDSKLDGKTETKREYIYDFTGKLIQVNTLTNSNLIPTEKPTGFTNYITDYEYDIFGNLLKETRTYEDGNSDVIQWSYDYRGNLVSYEVGSSVTRWYYDSHGNIVNEEWIYEGNVNSTTEYTYVSFQVTQKEAEFIKTQQDGIFQLPICDVMPKTTLAQG